MKSIFYVGLCLTLAVQVHAQELELFLNKDTASIQGVSITGAAFNWDVQYATKNAILTLESGTTYELSITNTDSLDHSFTIDGVLSENLPAEQTTSITIGPFDEGTFRYYSDQTYGSWIGASGQILVGFSDETQHFWNLFDLSPDLTYELADVTVTSFPGDYQPEWFTINGASFPDTLEDEDAYIQTSIGESIVISIVNSGHMEHVLHFHGFHVEIIECSINSRYDGWIKDTLPLKCGEAMTVRLVPNLLGIYPVHNHNLIAVTNAGFYPGGQLTHIVVE